MDQGLSVFLKAYPPPFYIKNEVNEIIEKVFESRGDVEFAEKATLKEYYHIARYYSHGYIHV